MGTAAQIKIELRKAARKEKALILARFFKTGKGEYGEGDKFLGVVAPDQRRIAKSYFAGGDGVSIPAALFDINELLQSEFHEDRLTALLILVELYKKSDIGNKKRIFSFYLKNLARINNWDLVDLSAPHIVGDYVLNSGSQILFTLAKRKALWTRRVAVLGTFALIKKGRFTETLALAESLLIRGREKQDLMHKAVGWMLREIGKRDINVLEDFLGQFAAQLPRTTLRYAIERFPETKRQRYRAMGKPAKNASSF